MSNIGQGDEIADSVGQMMKRAFLKYRLSVLEDVIARADSYSVFSERDEIMSTRRAVDEMMRETQRAIEEASA